MGNTYLRPSSAKFLQEKHFERQRSKSLAAMIAAALALPFAALADEPLNPVAASNMLDAALEELATMKVTSVSRGPESLAGAPAAISVLTDEDIRRAGVGNIPDALRLVPGLAVAQQDARTFAVSARGFNSARISGGYSFFQESNEASVANIPAASWDGASPQHQFFLRSMLDLPSGVTFDTTPNDRVEVAIVGRNLLDCGNKEFRPNELVTQRTEVPRSVFRKVTIRF